MTSWTGENTRARAGSGARVFRPFGGKAAGYREASRFAATCSQDTIFQNAVM